MKKWSIRGVNNGLLLARFKLSENDEQTVLSIWHLLTRPTL